MNTYTHIQSELDLINRNVRIHWHFHKKMYSVSVYVPKRGWRVVVRDYKQVFLGKAIIHNPKFKVNKGGKKRARREGKRNVHAFIEGRLIDCYTTPEKVSVPCGKRLYYSPFDYPEPFFVDLDTKKFVEEARAVSVGINNVRPEMVYVN